MIIFVPHPTDATKFCIKNAYMVRDKVRTIPGAVFNDAVRLPGLLKPGAYEVPLVNLEEAKRILPNAMMPPGVEEQFKEQLAEASRRIQVKNQTESNVTIPGLKSPNGWTLREYQKVGVEFLLPLTDGADGVTLSKGPEKGLNVRVGSYGGILAWDVGLGKSLGSLAAFLKQFNEGKLKRGLVICPAPLKYSTWVKEIEQWTDLPYIIIDGDIPGEVEVDVEEEAWVYGPDGKRAFEMVGGKKKYLKRKTGQIIPKIEMWSGKKLRDLQYQQDDRVIIVMNYELFLHDHEFIKRLGIDHTWGIMLDEAHRVKNSGQASKRLFDLCASAGWKALLTANPLENNIEELFNLIDFIRPGYLGTWTQYKDRYIMTDYFGHSTGQPNAQMLPELKSRISPLSMRRTKKECLDLPDLIVQDVWVDYTDAQAKLYDQIVEGILEDWAEGEEAGEEPKYLTVMAQITRLQQVCDTTEIFQRVLGQEVLDHDEDGVVRTNRKGKVKTKVIRNLRIPAESAKFDELWNIIGDIGLASHKIVIFSQYVEVTDIVFRELQLRYPQVDRVYIKGGLGSSEVANRVSQFQNDPKTRLALITTAANYGVELFDRTGTSEGEYIVCIDQHFNPQKMNQIYGRVHRSGQKNTVIVKNLLCQDGFEEAKMALLESKKALFAAMVEEGSLSDEAFQKLFTLEEIKSLVKPRRAASTVPLNLLVEV